MSEKSPRDRFLELLTSEMQEREKRSRILKNNNQWKYLSACKAEMDLIVIIRNRFSVLFPEPDSERIQRAIQECVENLHMPGSIDEENFAKETTDYLKRLGLIY